MNPLETTVAESLLVKACRRENTEKTPVWFMRQAGRYLPEYRKLREKYDLLTLCQIPELAAEITLLPIQILQVDAAILFTDLLLPLAPMGISFHYSEENGPIVENPIRTEQEVERLRLLSPKNDLAAVLDTIPIVTRELPPQIPLIGFAGAPFTLASYLLEGGRSRNFSKTKNFMTAHPKAWALLMEKLSQGITDFLLAQIEAGVSVIQLFDSWIGALSPEEYRSFALPYSSAILKKIASTETPALHFGTRTLEMLEVFSEAGGDVIGVDWHIPLDQAWKRIGHHRGIQGNLDPETLLGSKEVLKKEVLEILEKAEGRPGHIFNLGHGVLPQTPVDHVKAVVEWVKEYG